VLKVSVIILSWNTRELLEKAIRSLPVSNHEMSLEVIIVDNCSSDGSAEMVRSLFPDVQLIESTENLGFAQGINLGMEESRGGFLLLLNSDAELRPGAVKAMIALLQAQPAAGLVGAQILNPDLSLQASYADFPNLGREFLILSGIGRLLFGPWYPSHGPNQGRVLRQVDYVSGACLMIRREAYIETRGFDESFFMYAEEVDLCYRLRKKEWQVWYQPEAKVIHVGGGSSRSIPIKRETDLYRSRVAYFKKHLGHFSASLLAGMILCMTAFKFVIHSSLRRLSGGRHGRPVVAPRQLLAGLRDVI
jgi:N-acetylglucosaminyl-diphospho-decaprenol L-rhamnosyltransferase